MLPEELIGVTDRDIIDVIGEDCINTNPNIEDYFKVIIWFETETFLKYRVTNKLDDRQIFLIPPNMARHAEALCYVVREFKKETNFFKLNKIR